MIAVADASPLCYLVVIEEVDLLRQLFSRVFVPQAVIQELLHEDAPVAVRTWASNLPEWISVEHASTGVSRHGKAPGWRARRDSPRRVHPPKMGASGSRAYWVYSERRQRWDSWISRV